MSVLHRSPAATATLPTPPATTDPAAVTPEPPASAAPAKPRRTRTGAAWTATIVGVITSIALIIFIAQNTAPVKVSFVSLHGRFPLAVALLVAAAGSVLVVLVLGTARITQLRLAARQVRRTASRTQRDG